MVVMVGVVKGGGGRGQGLWREWSEMVVVMVINVVRGGGRSGQGVGWEW